jgi:hypothetical protein
LSSAQLHGVSYIYSLVLYIIKNKHIFNLNKEIHKYKTKALKNLHLLAIIVTKYSKGAYIAGIKVFNHLPLSLKMLATDTTSFKTALKRFLYHHSFYSMKEYYQQNWSKEYKCIICTVEDIGTK